jgi:SNF family Na+-dependent transporter
MTDLPAIGSSDIPTMSIIDTVSSIIEERLGFYRALMIAAFAIILALIALLTLTAQVSAWLGWVAKVGGGASAVIGIIPGAAYLKWRGLASLCRNYRQIVIDRSQSPNAIGDAAFARISASFWRLYETSWGMPND